MEIAEFQELMARTYGEHDRAAVGPPRSPGWPRRSASWRRRCARARAEQQLHELGDVLAWLASLANQLGLSLDDAAGRYARLRLPHRVRRRSPCTLPTASAGSSSDADELRRSARR